MIRLSGLVVVLTLALGLLSFGPAEAGVAVTPRTSVRGQCHLLTDRQIGAVSDTKAPVRCGRKHNVQTVGVVVPTAPVTATTSPAEIAQIGSDSCRAAWTRAAGASKDAIAVTTLTPIFFTPTAAELAAGQSWVRCDFAVLGRNGSLVRSTGKLKAKSILRHRKQTKNALCMTARGAWTSCSYEHKRRALKAFDLSGAADSAYPGQAAVEQAVWSRCPRRADYGTWPTPESWSYGARTVRCWKKD